MKPHRDLHPSELLSRRAFLRWAGIGGGAALLAACAPTIAPTPTTAAPTAAAPTTAAATTAPTTAATTAPTAAATASPNTLTFWTPGGSADWCAGFNTIAKNYMQAVPSVTIGSAQCYAGTQAFNEVLLAAIAAGNPPDGTIIWDSPVSFAVNGALEPLDALMAKSKYSAVQNWPAGVLASCQYKGQTYGLPVTAGSYSMFFNQEMFEAKGIPTGRADFPKTWDDLRKLSKEFTHWNGDTLETAGFIPWSNPANLGGAAIELAIWSGLNGSQLFDPVNLKYTLDTDQNIAMMQYAVDWLKEEYKGDIVKVRASGNWSGANPDSQGRSPNFQGGKLAIMTNASWFTGDMYGATMAFQRWEVAQFPVGPSGSKTVSGTWPNWMVIPKGSKHLQQIFDYLDYISGEGIKVWFNIAPDTPANKLVPADLIPSRVVDKRGQAFATDVEKFFLAQQDIAVPMWTSPVQAFGNDQIARAMDQILANQATPKDALGQAQKQCQAELDRVLKTA